MTVRTKTELVNEVTSMLTTGGANTAAEVRAILTDFADSLGTQAALDAAVTRIAALEAGMAGAGITLAQALAAVQVAGQADGLELYRDESVANEITITLREIPVTGDTFYIGWARPATPGNTRPTIVAADFDDATDYMGDSVEVPTITTAGDYLWWARDVYPSSVRRDSLTGTQLIQDFTQQGGTVTFGGQTYRIGVGNSRSSGSIAGHELFFED